MSIINQSDIKESDFVKSLEKGLLVINAFSAENKELSISEAAKIAGLSRPAARRILLTLTTLGYLSKNKSGSFVLTPKILSLSNAYFASNSIWTSVTPVLEKLSKTVNESTSISVIDDLDIVYVNRVATQRIMSVTLNIGSRLPIHATSMGQVIVSYLSEGEQNELLDKIRFEKFTKNTPSSKEELLMKCKQIKDQGYNIAQQELEEELTSIAAPIFNTSGVAVAAINISMSTIKFLDIKNLKDNYIEPLLSASKEISNLLENYFN